MENPERESLTRQRRLLITVSLVLTAKYLLAVEFTDHIEMLGASLRITRPEALIYGAWAVWAWALVRYRQYFKVAAVERIDRAKTKEIHRAATQELACKLCAELKEPGIEHDGQRLVGKVGEIMFPAEEGTKPLPGWLRDEFAEYRDEADGGRQYKCLMAPIHLSSGSEHLHMLWSPRLTGQQMRSARRRAWARYVLQSPEFTEYWAPFYVAAAPVLIWACGLPWSLLAAAWFLLWPTWLA